MGHASKVNKRKNQKRLCMCISANKKPDAHAWAKFT